MDLLPIWWEKFRESQKEDECWPLSERTIPHSAPVCRRKRKEPKIIFVKTTCVVFLLSVYQHSTSSSALVVPITPSLAGLIPLSSSSPSSFSYSSASLPFIYLLSSAPLIFPLPPLLIPSSTVLKFKVWCHSRHSFYLFCIFLTRHTLIQYSSSGWSSPAGYLPELGINSCVWVNKLLPLGK